jgi:hypothetical protein
MIFFNVNPAFNQTADFASDDSGEEAIRIFLIWRKQQKSLRRKQQKSLFIF